MKLLGENDFLIFFYTCIKINNKSKDQKNNNNLTTTEQ